MSEPRLSAVLLDLLGADGLVKLAEHKGGRRLFVPKSPDGGMLADTIGLEAAITLSNRYGGDYIRVPLARELRARHYRAAGASNAEIARRLGMSESGVDRLFHSMPNKPQKGSRDPRQGDLFL
ncbi:hypothetical protein [Nitratireductor sp. GZWM139]|uniref:hypothetical protein n=1 Tax=Nitratireductor sp. GZWM139 TaxID=2950541 RepID=UPI0024BD836B|nr:hypothetical protein [Nitratireductor sp. GZWM139]MDJ1463425.1 hypothetical protein [Nitratireductor sp. GZWM139]